MFPENIYAENIAKNLEVSFDCEIHMDVPRNFEATCRPKNRSGFISVQEVLNKENDQVTVDVNVGGYHSVFACSPKGYIHCQTGHFNPESAKRDINNPSTVKFLYSARKFEIDISSTAKALASFKFKGL